MATRKKKQGLASSAARPTAQKPSSPSGFRSPGDDEPGSTETAQLLQQNLRTLQEREALLSVLVESQGEGLGMVNTAEVFTFANPAAEQVFGVPRGTLVGRSLLSFLDAEDYGRMQKETDRRRQGERSTYELTIRRGDGEQRTILVTATPHVDDNGALIHTFGIFRDITDRKLAEHALLQARDDAERARSKLEQAVEIATRMAEEAGRANAAKSQFLAHMSHEVRTPLHAILGTAHVLGDSALDDDQRQLLETLQVNAENLLHIVDDLLDLSRVEAGSLSLEDVVFALRPVLDEAMHGPATRARDKGLQVDLRLGEDVPAELRGDPLRLNQVLVNLLSNAVKFTHKGHIDVEVTVQHRLGKDAVLRIEVRDTGIGVPANQLSRLFQPFSQADASITRAYGGTGLGLSISRKLVELMGGEIGMHSVQDQGSTFWLVLPLRFGPASASLPRPGPQSAPTRGPLARFVAPGPRVLVAEDNATNRMLASRLLERVGCRSVLVDNGIEALKQLTLYRFDAVLMDVQMPVLDGVAATRMIRSAQTRVLDMQVPIIALTAHALAEDRQRFLAAGMNDVVTKPVRSQELLQALVRATGHAVEALPAVPVAAPSSTTVALDLEALGQRLGDHDIALEIARSFADDAQALVETIAATAGDADRAALQRSAHTLKGSAGNVGAARLFGLATRLDHHARAGDRAALAPLVQELQLAMAELRSLLDRSPHAPAQDSR
ncbi:MAG: ATP-binding protein [Pseudomonadota bacterium]